MMMEINVPAIVLLKYLSFQPNAHRHIIIGLKNNDTIKARFIWLSVASKLLLDTSWKCCALHQNNCKYLYLFKREICSTTKKQLLQK